VGYEYEVQGNYGQGWECVTTEATRSEANAQCLTYDMNEPQYAHRVKRVEVENDD
jgi:hypothetical protein